MTLDKEINTENVNTENLLDSKPESIDDVVSPENEFKSRLEQKLEKPSNIFRVAFDTVLYSAFFAGQAFLAGPTIALSTLIPSAGFALGGWWENKKNKLKTTWKKTRREIYSGNMIGYADYAIFSTPELLFNMYPALFSSATISGMMATALVFNPLLCIPYVMAYQTFTYFRDNIGWKKIFTGMFNARIIGYFKEAYHNKIKKEIKTDMKNTFKYLFPLHFMQIHLWTNPTQRMVQSVLVNNPIYRVLMGKKKNEKTYRKKPVDNYAPAYA
ncbi:hypothetical protein HQ529_06135 [Candidatus Woesearchaeota archaeon]|nr:hypothetical protein [Candidatus Woesearchaeota archaeon]